MRRVLAGLLWVAAILALIALAWGAAVLYVQAAAARDVAALKRSLRYAPNPDGLLCAVYDETTFNRIRDLHGCRALPALVAELDPAADRYWTHTLSNLIRLAVSSSAVRDDLKDIWYDSGDAAECARKIDGLRAWWKEGNRHHQPWRFWSVRCHP